MSVNTPVLIAARNEASNIAQTLDVLSRQADTVEPIVVVNGSSDETASVAKGCGAVVLESEAGKMPALQAGLRYLGERALQPLLILDADTQPLTRQWSKHMTDELRALSDRKPTMVWGPYLFNRNMNPAAGLLFSIAPMLVSWADRHKELPRTVRGGNMGLFIKDKELLKDVLSLDNYWPREDVAIYDTMADHGAPHKVLFHPDAWVLTSGRRFRNIVQNSIAERRHPSLITDATYLKDAPPNSRPYNSKTTATTPHL